MFCIEKWVLENENRTIKDLLGVLKVLGKVVISFLIMLTCRRGINFEAFGVEFFEILSHMELSEFDVRI